MRFFPLILALCALTQTAAAASTDSLIALQQAAIQKLTTQLTQQKAEIDRLNALAPKVLAQNPKGGCQWDFGGQFLPVHSQTRVTVGIHNVQPSSAVYIINRQDNGDIGFLQVANNSPQNNNGNIWQSGTKIGADVGGIGASCTITMQPVF